MSNEDKKYNGWTNYETWVTKLWMDNEEDSYLMGQELAQDAYDNAKNTVMQSRDKNAMYDLAKTLKSSYEDQLADILENASLTASVWADLFGASLQEVNWYEIAEHMIDEIEKEEEEEKDESQKMVDDI